MTHADSMDITATETPHPGEAPYSAAPKLKIHTFPDIAQIPQLAALEPQMLRDLQIVARVLPFRVNDYVVEQLIDWSAVPRDPVFRLVFPDKGMLDESSFDQMARCVDSGGSVQEQRRIASAIRARLNPHPADQLSLNRPIFQERQIPGLQHKYPETALFFPSDGQTCHSYCTFCFRWPQFVSDKDLRIAMNDRDLLAAYLAEHREVSDVLITGGDAFTVKARRLRYFLEPLIRPELRHVTTVRFGTKALSFWPHRLVTDPDADELLDVIVWLRRHGKHVAVMAHFNHWRELTTAVAEEAIARLQAAGATIRTQGPLLRGINDDPEVWSTLWRRQVELGMIPYYMFVARDTGPRDYFGVPLARAWSIYAEASRQLSGLGRTARGPSMSASPGKIEVTGVAEVAGERVFVLRFLQARNPAWSHRPFFAKYDPAATWIDELKPAFGDREFFFEAEYRAMTETGAPRH